MAKNNPVFSQTTISNACSDIARIVEAKHLDQKDINHETSMVGALRIGRRLEQEGAGLPISRLNGLLSPIGKHLKSRFRPGLGPTYLTRCIKLARAVPDDIDFRPELDLEHYESLARIKDQDLRLELLNVAADNGWNTWRIELHAEYQGAQSVPHIWGYHHFEPNQEILRFARAYTDACGIISLEEFIRLYNSCAPKPVSRFEINETVWQLRSDSGKLDRPCIETEGETLYLIAPDFDDRQQEAPYHYDDYGYSYRSYERRSEYADEMRTLRQQRMNTRKAAILSGHKSHPIKVLGYDDVLCGLTDYSRAAEHLKQYVLRNQTLEAGKLHTQEDEFDFILLKLLRSVGLNGMPTERQIREDAIFLLLTIRPDIDDYDETLKVANLLSIIYKHAPIWELNGHSYAECSEKNNEKESRSPQSERLDQAA